MFVGSALEELRPPPYALKAKPPLLIWKHPLGTFDAEICWKSYGLDVSSQRP